LCFSLYQPDEKHAQSRYNHTDYWKGKKEQLSILGLFQAWKMLFKIQGLSRFSNTSGGPWLSGSSYMFTSAARLAYQRPSGVWIACDSCA
jgi:hypothetical protein